MSFSEKDSRKLRMFFSRPLTFLECEPGIAFLSPSIVNNEKIPPNIEYGKSRGKWFFGNTGGGKEMRLPFKANIIESPNTRDDLSQILEKIEILTKQNKPQMRLGMRLS